MDIQAYTERILDNAVAASVSLGQSSSAGKDAALLAAADELLKRVGAIQEANAEDVGEARGAGLSGAMLKRLSVTEAKIEDMAQGLRDVAALRDPVGEVLGGWVRPNGLEIQKVRVPIGVICMIYESRPNVTADAAGLCLKSGNACVLRGGKEALRTNLAIHGALAAGLGSAGIDANAIQIVNTPDREVVDLLCAAEGRIDVIIPRGGEALIRAVVDKARMPVIKHYKGVCATYVDAAADLGLARKVCMNAKVQYPAVCNAMETLLVHEAVAQSFLPALAAELSKAGCSIKGCARTRALVPAAEDAAEDDYRAEYNDLVLNVKVVAGLDEAVEHIAKFGSKHSDAIITGDLGRARAFARRVDSSAVFINTSTRFNDGGQFGFGAEIGISTDKLHARGPMALPELTSYKYIVTGSGQVRE